jgi:glycine/D-amino acid oxidase-like deaminating enzyme
MGATRERRHGQRDAARVLIVGAGIAGLATAGALDRIGWEVEVVERRACFNGTPAGLFIPANGSRALRGLGMAEGVIARGRAIERLVARTATGALSAGVDLERVWPGVGPCCAVQRDLGRETCLRGRRLEGLAGLEGGGDPRIRTPPSSGTWIARMRAASETTNVPPCPTDQATVHS